MFKRGKMPAWENSPVDHSPMNDLERHDPLGAVRQELGDLLGQAVQAGLVLHQ